MKIPISHHQGNHKEFPINRKCYETAWKRTSVYIVKCTVRRRVWVAKDSPRTTAGELKNSGSENLKIIVKQHLHHQMMFGRVSRKIILALPKQSSIFSYQTRLELQTGLASLVRWNKKNSFLAANTQDGFGEHGDKKYPCVQWNILLYFLYCGPIFLLVVLDILFRHMTS